MSNYIRIYEGTTDEKGLFPFSTIDIPQYSNRPAYSKFSNFLLNKVEKHEPRLTCDVEIAALVAAQNSLQINTDRCIACLACLCSQRNPARLLHTDISDVIMGIVPGFAQLKSDILGHGPFSGVLKRVPPKETLSLKISSFDQYTSEKELTHIALWTTIMLQLLAADSNASVGKEIQIANRISPRDNRLDTCCLSNDMVLIGETKNSLDSLLQESRYRVQVPSYQAICDELVRKHNAVYGRHKKVMVLLVVGGQETDLLPLTHPQCTSLIGNRGRRFYNDIINYNIRFISATMLWMMAVYTFTARKRLCWDLLFPQVFANPDVLGILSGGQVVIQGNQIGMEVINPRVLDAAMLGLS